MLGSSGSLKFVILAKDLDTGGLSSITVRKETYCGKQPRGKGRAGSIAFLFFYLG